MIIYSNNTLRDIAKYKTVKSISIDVNKSASKHAQRRCQGLVFVQKTLK